MDAMVPSARAFSILSKARQAVLSVVPSFDLPHVIEDVTETRDFETLDTADTADAPTPPPAIPSKLSYCAAAALGPMLFPALLPVAIGSYVYHHRYSADTPSGLTEQTYVEESPMAALDIPSTGQELIQLGRSLRKHSIHGHFSLTVAGNGLGRTVVVRTGGRGAQPMLYRVAIFPSEILELKYNGAHISSLDPTTVRDRRRLSSNMNLKLYVPPMESLRYEIAHVTSATVVDLDVSDGCWYEFCASRITSLATRYQDWDEYTADQAVRAMTFWLKRFSEKAFRLDSAIDLTLSDRRSSTADSILERPMIHGPKSDVNETEVSDVEQNTQLVEVSKKDVSTENAQHEREKATGQPIEEPARQEPNKKVSRFNSIFKSTAYQKAVAPQTANHVDGVKFFEENISARLAEVNKENKPTIPEVHVHVSPLESVKCEPVVPTQAAKPSVEKNINSPHNLLQPVAANKVKTVTPKPRVYRRVSYLGYRERIEARTRKHTPKVLRNGKESSPSLPAVVNQRQNQSSALISPIQPVVEQAEKAPKQPVSRFSSFFQSSSYVDKISKSATQTYRPFADLSLRKPHVSNAHKESVVTLPAHRQKLARQEQAVPSYANIDPHGSDQSKELEIRARTGFVWVPPQRQPLSVFPLAQEVVDPNWDECDRNPRCRRASDDLLAGEPPHPLVDRIVDNMLGLNRIQELGEVGEVHQIEDVDAACPQPLENLTHPATPDDQNGFQKTLGAQRASHGAIGDGRPMVQRVGKLLSLREPDVFADCQSSAPDCQAANAQSDFESFAGPTVSPWSTTGVQKMSHKRDDSGVVLNVLEEDEIEQAKMYFHKANALFRTRMKNIRLRNDQLASSPDSSEIGSSPPVGIPMYGNSSPLQDRTQAQQPFFSALDHLRHRNAHIVAVDSNEFDSSDFGSLTIGYIEEESRNQPEASMEFPKGDAAMLAGDHIEGDMKAQQPVPNTLEALHHRNAHLHGFDPRDAPYFPDFDGVWIEPSNDDLQKQAGESMELPEANPLPLNDGWDVEFWQDSGAHAEWHNVPRLRPGSIEVQG